MGSSRIDGQVSVAEEIKVFWSAQIFKFEGIHFSVDLDPSNPKINGDEGKIHQIILNLVSNSKHAVEGVESPNIQIKTYQKDGKAHLEVSDNGRGISKKNLDKVFDSFFTTKNVGEGTGLGLSLCQNLARDMEAVMNVTSEEGKGAAFTLSFPID